MATLLLTAACACVICSCKDDEDDGSGGSDTKEYVDLGLPSGTLWATCNIGASSPEKYGSYFSWGETEFDSKYREEVNSQGTVIWSGYVYTWGTYTYSYTTEKSTTMTKYCTEGKLGKEGFTDDLTELDASDDVATAKWGSEWQMPSQAQFQELINSNNTTTTWTQQSGVNGRLIKSKKNGNSIFLPAAGNKESKLLNDQGAKGYYWSRSLGTSSSDGSGLYFYSNVIGTDCDIDLARYMGLSVRPVRKK